MRLDLKRFDPDQNSRCDQIQIQREEEDKREKEEEASTINVKRELNKEVSKFSDGVSV